MYRRGISSLLVGVGAVTLVAGLIVWGQQSQASSDQYTFLVRGIVTEANHSANTVRMYATHTSAEAKADLSGTEVDYNVSDAVFYKWSNGVKTRVTWTKSAQIGDEIVMRGAAKGDGRYNVSWLVVNDRSFEVTGKLIDYDQSNMKVTVSVTSSTFKPTMYNGKDLVIYYRDNTKFYARSGAEMEQDALSADTQKVKLVGSMEKHIFKASKLYNDLK
jgi:hypothetical protein